MIAYNNADINLANTWVIILSLYWDPVINFVGTVYCLTLIIIKKKKIWLSFALNIPTRAQITPLSWL